MYTTKGECPSNRYEAVERALLKKNHLSERLFENYLRETLHVIEIKAEPPHVTKC